MRMDVSEEGNNDYQQTEVIIIEPKDTVPEDKDQNDNNNVEEETKQQEKVSNIQQNETRKLSMQVSTSTANETDPDEEYCFEESTIYEDKNAFILKLIEKIKLNRCLYDHTCAGWRSIETKKEVWEKIGKELQVDNGV